MKHLKLFMLLLMAVLVILGQTAGCDCGDDDDDDDTSAGDDDDDNDDDNNDTSDDDDDDNNDDNDDDNDDDNNDDNDDDTTMDFEKGLYFDGDTGYAYAADDATLNPGGDMTVEAWVRIAALPTYQVNVVDKQGSPVKGEKAAQGGYVMRVHTSGTVAFCVGSSGSPYCAVTMVALSLNTWHHVVGIHDATADEVRIYLDGANMANTATAGNPIDDTANELWIARHIASTSNYDEIDVDEIRISDSVRVSGLTYTVPTGPYTVDGNTLALWHMDEGTGTTAADSSTNGNDLTLSGGVSWIDHD